MSVRAMRGYWSHEERRWMPPAGTPRLPGQPDVRDAAAATEADGPAQQAVPDPQHTGPTVP